MRTLALLPVIGGVLLSGTIAHAAAVLATAPAQNENQMFCDIVNLNITPKNVTIEVMDYSGNVVTGPLQSVLPPNAGVFLQDTSFIGAWCRFTADGSSKKYRAAAVYRDTSFNYAIAIPAQ